MFIRVQVQLSLAENRNCCTSVAKAESLEQDNQAGRLQAGQNMVLPAESDKTKADSGPGYYSSTPTAHDHIWIS